MCYKIQNVKKDPIQIYESSIKLDCLTSTCTWEDYFTINRIPLGIINNRSPQNVMFNQNTYVYKTLNLVHLSVILFSSSKFLDEPNWIEDLNNL